MNDEHDPEVTREGFFERIVGEVEETTGELIGNEHLVEEGRRKQAEAQADGAGEDARPAATDA